MWPAFWHRVLHATLAVGAIVVIFAISLRLPHVSTAMLALVLLLCIAGIAMQSGWVEALAATIAGLVGLDYFLPERGFFIREPETWVTLISFCFAAIIMSQLIVHTKRRRIIAEQQGYEMEKLYQLVNVLLDRGGEEANMETLAEKIRSIFAAKAVAIYDIRSGQIFRCGHLIDGISDQALHEAAKFDRRFGEAEDSFSVVPIRHSGEVAGSIGIVGGRLSPALLDAIAGHVGMGLAAVYAAEMATAAEVARRTEELKSAVLDAVAHDIRNPLNSVKLAATSLRSGHIRNELDRQEMLTIIDEEANRMDRAIHEAVELARMEPTQLALQKEPQNLAHLAAAAVEEIRPRAGHRGLHVNIPDSLPPAECDGKLMLRVLKQLLGNALKYSPGDSPLTVSAGVVEEAIVIDVEDHGPGVRADERQRIFEKYYRGRAARSGIPGTGLGLSAAKSIVEAHGGLIWVTDASGGGAVFHVSLPMTDATRSVGVV